MKVLGEEVPIVNGMYDLNFIAFALGLPENRSPQTWAYNLPGFSAAALRVIGPRVYADEHYTEFYLNWLLPDNLSEEDLRNQLLRGGTIETTTRVDSVEVDVIWVNNVPLYPSNGVYPLSQIQYGIQREADISVNSFVEHLPELYLHHVQVEARGDHYWGNKSAVYEYLAHGYPETLNSLIMTGKVLRMMLPSDLANKLIELSRWK